MLRDPTLPHLHGDTLLLIHGAVLSVAGGLKECQGRPGVLVGRVGVGHGWAGWLARGRSWEVVRRGQGGRSAGLGQGGTRRPDNWGGEEEGRKEEGEKNL